MALRKGLIVDAPYTEADVRNALIIHGSCPTCSKAKGTRHKELGHYPVMPERPGERLAGDLFAIGGILFSLISCRLIKLRCVTRLQNKGATEVTRAIRECVNIWKGYGSKPKVLSWDQEPALVHCAAEIWAQHSLRVEFTSPDAHERVAERDVRTVKEHVYSCIMSLGHAVDEEMVEGIVRDTITLLNFFPNSETVDGTPRTHLDGERLNYERWSRVYAGQVAEFELPYAKAANRGVRMETGYVIGHQGDNPVVLLIPGGRRLVVRSGHIRPLEKTPAIIALIEQGIQGARRQRYNDLLCEIDDFFAHEDAERDTRPNPSLPPPRDDIITESPDRDVHGFEQPSTPAMRIEESPAPEQPAEAPAEVNAPQAEVLIAPTPVASQRQDMAGSADHNSPLRRSERRGAQKPPGFYSKLASGESVADYTACHLRAHECSRLYGAEVTKDAGTTEVLNMIRDRKAALPQDYRKLSQRVISEAVSSFMFFKAKDLLPQEEKPTEEPKAHPRGGGEPSATGWTTVKSKRQLRTDAKIHRVKVRGRWVGGGHQQSRGEALAERVAPTARGATHNMLLAIAAFEGRKILVGDIPSAYLQADHVPANGKAVYIIADRYTTSLIVESMPEYKDFVRPNGTMILKVLKAMYGLVESAWLWYKELERHLVSIGYTVSDNDRGLFYKKVFKNGKCIASNFASVHVDDIISAASPNDEGRALETEFWTSMELKWPGIKLQRGPTYKHLS